MTESKKLNMSFATRSGRRMTVSVQSPREDVDAGSVGRVMNRLIKSDVFLSRDGSNCEHIRKAAVIKTTVTDLLG